MTEKTKQLTIRLPKTVHKKLKLLAAYENTTMLALIVQWIEQSFEKSPLALKADTLLSEDKP